MKVNFDKAIQEEYSLFINNVLRTHNDNQRIKMSFSLFREIMTGHYLKFKAVVNFLSSYDLISLDVQMKYLNDLDRVYYDALEHYTDTTESAAC